MVFSEVLFVIFHFKIKMWNTEKNTQKRFQSYTFVHLNYFLLCFINKTVTIRTTKQVIVSNEILQKKNQHTLTSTEARRHIAFVFSFIFFCVVSFQRCFVETWINAMIFVVNSRVCRFLTWRGNHWDPANITHSLQVWFACCYLFALASSISSTKWGSHILHITVETTCMNFKQWSELI